MEETKKLCSKCGMSKIVSEFDKQTRCKSGFRHDCKSCRKIFYQENKVFLKNKTKEYYKSHREERILYSREYRKTRKSDRRAYKLKKNYNLSLEDYEKLLIKCNRSCAICSVHMSEIKKKNEFVIDHDHKTNKIRGLLCGKCNRGIGMFNDNVDLLKCAICYLENNNVSI